MLQWIFEPAMPSGSLDIQRRDLELLVGLVESRILTAAHISSLYFAGKPEAAKKRLQRLKAAGLIRERRRLPNQPAILSISRAGFNLVCEHGLLSSPEFAGLRFENRTKFSDLTLRHELQVLDCKAAICSAVAKTPRFEVIEFSTRPAMHQFNASPVIGSQVVLVKPDGFIRILENEEDGERGEHAFFLEVDRSTETQQRVVNKGGCYADYYRSGGFAQRNGATAEEFKDFPFLVLMVFQTPERRNIAAEQMLLLSPPVKTQAWLTTFTELMSNPLGSIWVRPLEYLPVLGHSIYSKSRAGVYRRQVKRDALVEASVSKRPLLETTIPQS
jgi:hypothetical protein